jgi:hypothetical protein
LTIFFIDKLSNLNQQTKDEQFENVVAVTFQSAFHLEIDQNIFFFKKSFLISAYQNDLKTFKKILI